jgi:hypothetical protein
MLRVILLVAVLFVGIVVLGYVVSHSYEVVDEGRLLPYTDAQVAKLRFFDEVTLYVTKERPRPLDVVNATLFAMLAGVALFSLLLLQPVRGSDERVKVFLVIALLGSLYLAADEMLGIHETVGHNLRFLADLPAVHRPDDVVFASYAVPAVIVVVVFKDLIWSSRPVALLFAAGLALFVVAGAADVAGVGIDELAEPLSTGCLGAGFTRIALAHVRDADA